MLVIEHLLKALKEAAVYNPDVQDMPVCILWPDHDQQWETVITRLQKELPELLILGNYEPQQRTGPAIWMRCVIAGKIEGISIPDGKIPIIYLPGISRQELRAVANYPDYLKPIAELQYRGTIWSQSNARDWTLVAFLQSDHGGLGLDVAKDKPTINALQGAIHRFLDEDTDLLKNKRLDSNYFNILLSGDPIRDVLQWFSLGDAFQEGRGENEWHAFVEVCKSNYKFDPDNDGLLAGATKLAQHDGTWLPIWDRYCEAPKNYPNIPELIRRTSMPDPELFTNVNSHGGWPQWNEEQENTLRSELKKISNMPPHKARKLLIELEENHGERRSLVWTGLGESPLACALQWLAVIADITANSLAAGTIDDLVLGYRETGWKADSALVKALSCVDKQADVEAVHESIRAIYSPWAVASAIYLQELIEKSGYPRDEAKNRKTSTYVDGEAVLFIDGLRFDIAKRLVGRLSQLGYQIEENPSWVPLPSITATGKPAVSPVCDQIHGDQANIDFEPSVANTGQSLKGGNQLIKLITSAGWQILKKSEMRMASGNAWCEFSDIDHDGHDRGWKLSKYIDGILREILDRIQQLMDIGWKRVRVVTDHGWLLLPGGLPKIDLPVSLTEHKWGRCATIKPGAVTDERLYPWYWNPEQQFALANGISCYKKGEEYAHGGLSLQECLVLELTVSPAMSSLSSLAVDITDITWKGLRCKVAVDGKSVNFTVDIRQKPGNPDSSVAMSVKQLDDDGNASLVVENDELEGSEATIVLLNENGELIRQVATVIGGGKE